jgi:hypothetical protein
MSTAERLAQDILDARSALADGALPIDIDPSIVADLAGHLTARGYVRQETVETHDELADLPLGTVIRIPTGHVLHKQTLLNTDATVWTWSGYAPHLNAPGAPLVLPAVVLYRLEEA